MTFRTDADGRWHGFVAIAMYPEEPGHSAQRYETRAQPTEAEAMAALVRMAGDVQGRVCAPKVEILPVRAKRIEAPELITSAQIVDALHAYLRENPPYTGVVGEDRRSVAIALDNLAEVWTAALQVPHYSDSGIDWERDE